jgi:gephyrin
MLSSSLKQTPFAALSRPVAGTIKSTLVTTLPGSVKAVKENLEALLNGGVIHHAVDLIQGGSGKSLHKELAAGAAVQPVTENRHTHDHHHHHEHKAPVPRSTPALSNDPSAPGTCIQICEQNSSLIMRSQSDYTT